MTREHPSSAYRARKPKQAAERQIADSAIFQPYGTRHNRKPTTTLAHAAAASRSSHSRRAQLQGRQVTESTQAPAMAAALDAEMKKTNETPNGKSAGKNK